MKKLLYLRCRLEHSFSKIQHQSLKRPRGDVDPKNRQVDITITCAFRNRMKSLCPSMLPRKCWKLYPATDYIFSHGVFNHKVEHHTVPYQPYDVLVGFSLTAYLFQLFFEQAHPLKLHFRGLARIGAKLHLYHS